MSEAKKPLQEHRERPIVIRPLVSGPCFLLVKSEIALELRLHHPDIMFTES